MYDECYKIRIVGKDFFSRIQHNNIRQDLVFHTILSARQYRDDFIGIACDVGLSYSVSDLEIVKFKSGVVVETLPTFSVC